MKDEDCKSENLEEGSGAIDPPTQSHPQNNLSDSGDESSNSDVEVKDLHPLEKLSADFITRVDEMRRAATIAIVAVGNHIKDKVSACKDVFKKYADPNNSTDKKSYDVIIPEDVRERVAVIDAIKQFERIRSAGMLRIVERSLFIGLFSEFDAFMGHLLTILYTKQPALLKSIKREVSLSDLIQFNSLDAVKQDMLDKEIDSFRRDSYIEQFAALESKFSFKTLRKFPEWSEFVEISQRRNLMTHNGGVVTEQYLTVCKREGCKIEENAAPGVQLDIGAEYYFRACHVLSLVAVMLVFTLWRKVLPGDEMEANNAIQSQVYETLRRRDWKLAVRVGEFSLADEMRKGAEDIDIRIRHINLAIAYKKAGREEDMVRCLNSCDWTASVRDFKLAVEVLNGNYKLASDIMRKIGKSGELVQQGSYHNWPLFFDFIGCDEFGEAYREIYGHDFNAKREDEPVAVTIDAGGENGSSLTIVEKQDDLEVEPKNVSVKRIKKTTRKKKTQA